MRQKIWDLCEKYYQDIVKIRREIHMYPELEFDLPRTAGVIVKELEKLPLQIRTNIAQHGIVADLEVKNAQRRVALRADMDALPIQEMNDVAYKSTIDGKAHMCGHDAHSAMLIGAARILCDMHENLPCSVRFIFQPCEEKYPGGASRMIAEGAIEGVDEIYGLHVWPIAEVGTMAITPGAFMGQPDDFTIEIIGTGSHAATPHYSIDPIVIACQYVTMLQSIVARNLNPFDAAVISVTQINSGSAFNIIPTSAVIKGTVRTLDAKVQQTICAQMEKMLRGITDSHGATYQFDYQEGYPVTYNHEQCVTKALRAAENAITAENIHYPYTSFLGGEDFAYYTQKIPGCFVALGSGNTEKNVGKKAWHHPEFDIDEDCMKYGMALHVNLVLG